jgi:NAD-dependent dihydropyrimidine dehydrogenase PreA subunit
MAKINSDLCTGCESCLPYCSVNAISIREEKAFIDPNRCTECYVCIRNEVCPSEAIEKTPIESFIHQFQHVISDPTETTAATGVPGRGTEEAKTNDVTGRFKKGEAGVCIDMGRPGVGCYLRDVEKVAMAVAAAGVELAGSEHTPLAQLLEDVRTGKLKPDIPREVHLLSVIIEGKCLMKDLAAVLQALKKVEKEIDTVFSLGLACRVDEKGYSPALEVVRKLGLPQPIRGKVNVGLGRPLVTD